MLVEGGIDYGDGVEYRASGLEGNLTESRSSVSASA